MDFCGSRGSSVAQDSTSRGSNAACNLLSGGAGDGNAAQEAIEQREPPKITGGESRARVVFTGLVIR